jgi:hypothetical protein
MRSTLLQETVAGAVDELSVQARALDVASP